MNSQPHWTTGFAPLLALTWVTHKPNHLQYSLNLTLPWYFFSQAKTSTLKSNNQLQHMWNSFTHPPITQWKNTILHKDQQIHTAQSCCIRREAPYCTWRRASPPSNPLLRATEKTSLTAPQNRLAQEETCSSVNRCPNCKRYNAITYIPACCHCTFQSTMVKLASSNST